MESAREFHIPSESAIFLSSVTRAVGRCPDVGLHLFRADKCSANTMQLLGKFDESFLSYCTFSLRFPCGTKQSPCSFFGGITDVGNSMELRHLRHDRTSIDLENPLFIPRHHIFQRRKAFVAQNRRRTQFEKTRLLMFGEHVRHQFIEFFTFLFFQMSCCQSAISQLIVVNLRKLRLRPPTRNFSCHLHVVG